MHTILSSATKTVRIGDDQPFAIIGERINPTGRKIFQLQLRNGDLSRVEIDVKEQVAGGAMLLDVNMGAPLADEAELMTQAVTLIQELTDLPLVIDSSIIEVLDAGPGRLPGQGAGQLGDGRGRAAGRDPAAGEEVRRRRDRPAERRGGDPRGAGPAGRAGPQAHPRRHREVQDRGRGHRHRPAGHAGRRGHPAPGPDARDDRPDQGRVRGEHDAGRVERDRSACRTGTRSPPRSCPSRSATG